MLVVPAAPKLLLHERFQVSMNRLVDLPSNERHQHLGSFPLPEESFQFHPVWSK